MYKSNMTEAEFAEIFDSVFGWGRNQPKFYEAECKVCGQEFQEKFYMVRNFQKSKYCSNCRDSHLFKKESTRWYGNISRARCGGTDYDLELWEWMRCIKFFDYKCAYCQKNNFTCMEHIIPIKQGGGTTLTNILPACHGCNHKKGGSSFIDVSREHLNKIQEWFIHASNL